MYLYNILIFLNAAGLSDVVFHYRKIYWNDYEYCNARIETANMDGSDKQVVIQLNDDYEKCHSSCISVRTCLRRFTNQMELNYTSNELYWVDGRQDVVESISINGTNYRALHNITYGFGLGLDIHDIYLTSWQATHDGYSLWKWRNSPSSPSQSLRHDIAGQPMDIAVVRRDKRPTGNQTITVCIILRKSIHGDT